VHEGAFIEILRLKLGKVSIYRNISGNKLLKEIKTSKKKKKERNL